VEIGWCVPGYLGGSIIVGGCLVWALVPNLRLPLGAKQLHEAGVGDRKNETGMPGRSWAGT
jgi:hypothetical protein